MGRLRRVGREAQDRSAELTELWDRLPDHRSIVMDPRAEELPADLRLFGQRPSPGPEPRAASPRKPTGRLPADRWMP